MPAGFFGTKTHLEKPTQICYNYFVIWMFWRKELLANGEGVLTHERAEWRREECRLRAHNSFLYQKKQTQKNDYSWIKPAPNQKKGNY